MTQYIGIAHSSVIVSRLEDSLNFYQDVLGMKLDNTRPSLGYPGAWLTLGDQQIHLLQLHNPDSTTNRPEHGGRDRHTAILVRGFEELVETLKKSHIEFTLSTSGRKALFCRDPDGNTLEMISVD